MSLRTEVKKDEFGLVSPWPNGGGSGNGLLYTSIYYVLLVNRGESLPEDRNDFVAIIRNCQVEPGLLKRSPVHPDQEGPDDYVGVAAAAYKLGVPEIAKEWLAYGERNGYNYNNVSPGVITPESYLGRQRQIVAHFKYAAGYQPDLLELAWWYTAVASGAFAKRENQDAKTLSWLLLENSGLKHEAMYDLWKWRLNKQFPGGLKEVWTNYYGFEHPLAKCAPGFARG